MKNIICIFVLLLTGAMPALAKFESKRTAFLPAAVIALPRGEHAVLVDKQSQRFYIYGVDDLSSGLIRVFETACSTGEAPGPKQVEGDKKTPEGIYFLMDEHLEKDLTPIYGPRAFPMDYPHLMDRQQGKTGYAIWIHGTNKPLKPMDTNGCVALENADAIRLSDYVTLHVTPVIIQETIGYVGPEERARWQTAVTGFVAGWVQAHMTGTAEEFTAFYLPGSGPDIRDWDVWEQQRRLAADTGYPFRIHTSRIGIYRHAEMLVVTMDFELIHGAEHHLLGRRKLFVRIDGAIEGGEEMATLWIAGDEFQEDPGRPRAPLAVLADGADRLQGSR